MLEGLAGKLFDAPALPKMCYDNCPQGLTGMPHVSTAILHGVAYVESTWHQFNTSDYSVNGESAQCLTVDYGVAGCHGYPTSKFAAFPNSGLGSDLYLRQNFQTGYIVWDATTNMLVADVRA